MSQKKRHVLTVYSQEISLFSEDTEDYMRDLAAFVDARMHGFAGGVSRISFGDLCILTSLSIADDFFKTERKIAELEKERAKLEDDLSEALSKIMLLEASARERESKLEQLQEKMERMGSSMHTGAEAREELIKKLNVLSYELRKAPENRTFEQTLKESYELVEETKGL
ncbi:MAG: cell division protein ZapA [Bacillota bacterium]|nr:cell division protein ZapA [Bacillota bacterium]